jgi:hypothetical protein
MNNIPSPSKAWLAEDPGGLDTGVTSWDQWIPEFPLAEFAQIIIRVDPYTLLMIHKKPTHLVLISTSGSSISLPYMGTPRDSQVR